MKILLISNMYPSKKYPHYGVFVENTEKILMHAGEKVEHIVLKKMDGKFQKLYGYLLFSIKILFCLTLKKYDAIYVHYVAHCSIPVLFGRKISFRKLNIISNVHGNDVVPEEKSDEKYLKYAGELLKISNRVVVPSNYFKGIISREYHVDESKISIFPSGGIDHSIFYPVKKEDACLKLGLDSKYRYISYVSRIEKAKGWDVFLSAVVEWKTEIPDDVRFIVVGDGDQLDKYNELVEKYNIGTLITKFNLLSQQEIRNVFSVSDIFCFPTYRKSESLGLVGLEAMACGCIVLASQMAGPTSYIIDSENGYFFQPQEHLDLLAKIKRILREDTIKINEIKVNARKKSNEYDIHKVENILTDVFRKEK